MNGPHGLYQINLDAPRFSRKPDTPFEVHERLGHVEQGLKTVYLYVTSMADDYGHRDTIANAFCDFVEGDYATRDAAAQWLLDMATLRHGI